jgi:hypothetical protein
MAQKRVRARTTIMGVTARVKYVPLLLSRKVARVMIRHAQQTAALSRRRWMAGRVKLRDPALFTARLFHRILTIIIAATQYECERMFSKRLNTPVQKELATSESEKAMMISFRSAFALCNASMKCAGLLRAWLNWMLVCRSICGASTEYFEREGISGSVPWRRSCMRQCRSRAGSPAASCDPRQCTCGTPTELLACIHMIEKEPYENAVQKCNGHAVHVKLRYLQRRVAAEEQQGTIGRVAVDYERRVNVSIVDAPLLRKS